MATLCRAYSTDDDANAAVDRLLAARITGLEVRVLMGEPVRDHRDAPVGRFAGGGQAEQVGAFDGMPGNSRDMMGAFTADAGRRGGFGDLDRETVTSYHNGVPRLRVASHRKLKRMLVAAGLDEATAETDVRALHDGRIVVLVRTGSTDGAEAARVLDAAVSV
jgi:hypothetical protein